MNNIPWERKHTPTTFDDFIFQTPKHENKFRDYVEQGIIPHLFLSGFRGTGKTALVYLLKHLLMVEDIDFLKINASDDNSVEVIRNRVKKFISSMPIGEFKIVFFDEADALSLNAQEALKSIVEDESDTVRFIFSCNRPHKIISEIKSRCHEYSFKSLNKDMMLEKIAEILAKEKINVKSVELLEEYVDQAYPDMRKLINLSEQNSINGTLTELTEDDLMADMEHVVKLSILIKDNSVMSNREYIYESISDDECMTVYGNLIDYVDDIFDDIETQKQAIVIISDCMYRDYFVAMKQPTLESCIIRLSNLKL